MSSEEPEAITDTAIANKDFYGKSASDFLILLIITVTMLVLDAVLSFAYYRSNQTTDLRWLLAFLDLTVILCFYSAFGGRVKHMLLSMKLAVTLLFVTLILSVIGTILPQGELVATSGWPRNPLYGLYSSIGLFDMYRSRWFLAILYLLGFNLGFCIIDRFPTTLRRALRPRIDVKDIFVRKCPTAATIEGEGERGLPVAKEIISGHRYHLRTSDSGAALAQKGRWSGLASICFHLSFLLIGVGAIITGTLGYKEKIDVPDGKSAPVPHTDLRVTNHEFTIETAPVMEGDRIVGYRPSVYSSDLELTQDDQSLERKTITVNDPLRYSSSNWLLTLIISNKVSLHQSSYYQSNTGYVTVLEERYQPGKSLIYIGFFMTMGGISFSIYCPHRRIWIKVGESGELLLGGRSNRSKVTFQKDFERIVAELRLTLGKQEAT